MNLCRALVSGPYAWGGRDSGSVAQEMHEMRTIKPANGNCAKLGHLEKTKTFEKAYVLRTFTKAPSPRKADLSEDGLGRLKSLRMAELATNEGVSMLDSQTIDWETIEIPWTRTSILRPPGATLHWSNRELGWNHPLQDRRTHKL